MKNNRIFKKYLNFDRDKFYKLEKYDIWNSFQSQNIKLVVLSVLKM